MSWRIIYIEEAMRVQLYLDNIKIVKATTEVVIPLSDIHTLIIDNHQISITVPLINKCTEYNINFIICSIEHMPQAIINPYIGNYQYPLMLKKQIMWEERIKLELHRLIIQNKINNQIDLLKNLNKSKDVIARLYEFKEEVQAGDLQNREGLSAKMYFRELFGSEFKRFEDDIINVGLNYGYAILRSQISKTLISKGITPCLGIFHKGYNNPFNLSDDIIEVFRPLVDKYVYEELRDALLFKKEHRLGLIALTVGEVYIKSSRQTIFNAIGIFIDKILDVFEENNINLYEEIHLIYEL